MAGYHTGYAFALGQSVGARHSHLDNAGYSYDQSAKEIDDEKIINYLLEEEKERCILTSLCICLFARKVYDRKTILEAFSSIGINLTDQDLNKIANDIFFTRIRIKEKLGFTLDSIKFPKRIFETDTLWGKLDENRMKNLLNLYRERVKKEYENWSRSQ